jgi:hypothetical protein
MANRTIFFTHIPKTAGTSIQKTVFAPNVSPEKRKSPRGVRDLISNRESFQYMGGHMPYGYHRFFREVKSPLYFVILRDPIERAISHYYNILYPRGDKDVPDHPDFEVARTHELVEFYQSPRFQNLQTRMMAGIAAERLGRLVDLNEKKWVGKVVLRLARRNLLKSHTEIGLTERFEETARRFADRLNFTYEPRDHKSKVVPDRPTKDGLSSAEQEALRRSNRLDVKIYEFACDLFEQKPSATKA